MTRTTLAVNPAAVRCEGRQYYCEGDWTLYGTEAFSFQLSSVTDTSLQLDASGIHSFDTTGALQLLTLIADLERQDCAVQLIGLRQEQQTLLELVQERRMAAGLATPPRQSMGFFGQLGKWVVRHLNSAVSFLAFIGEVAIALSRLVLHPRRFRWQALFADIETAGVYAVPIVGLLAFMMGVVIAYQGGQQLGFYGANIFIVELVSLTMLRELAPLVTAIIVAGRTGSSYTAQIGTMQVTEEVDALRTIGISPIDLLVVPKLISLTVALPLLVLFADVLSVFGGMVMAQLLLDVSFRDFIDRFPQVVTLTSFMLGIGKAPIFAAIISLVGCYQGFRVRGGADSVGRQTTVSVVQSIFLVIAADAVFSVILGSVGL